MNLFRSSHKGGFCGAGHFEVRLARILEVILGDKARQLIANKIFRDSTKDLALTTVHTHRQNKTYLQQYMECST